VHNCVIIMAYPEILMSQYHTHQS